MDCGIVPLHQTSYLIRAFASDATYNTGWMLERLEGLKEKDGAPASSKSLKALRLAISQPN
jgi:hypothetical protein